MATTSSDSVFVDYEPVTTQPADNQEEEENILKECSTNPSSTDTTRRCTRQLQAQLTEASWQKALQKEFSKAYFKKLQTTLVAEYEKRTVFPALENVFAALNLCPLAFVKVVILGQDPYHNGAAVGLSFSVKNGHPMNPSLRNILTELTSDVGGDKCKERLRIGDGDLTSWATQGVFTDAVIACVNERPGKVFILWGQAAATKKVLIDGSRHCVINSAHPSPFSADRGFFGSRPFSRANTYLKSHGIDPISWD